MQACLCGGPRTLRVGRSGDIKVGIGEGVPADPDV
jgi:hypothetical protein